MPRTIRDVLGAAGGTVAVVGAGGKKTTLYALAARAGSDGSGPVVLTATVRIPIFDPHVDRVVVTDDPVSTATRAAEDGDRGSVGLVPDREGEDRYRGYDPSTVDALAAVDGVDLTLVKADGARTREFKAPGEGEPVIPRSADVVVPVASMQVLGKPLSSEVVHRPERVAAVTGLDPGDRIRPTDVARVLASDHGGLKGVPDGATVIPLLNKVDDDVRETATTVAREILDRAPSISRVVLAQMIDDDPLVDVIE